MPSVAMMAVETRAISHLINLGKNVTIVAATSSITNSVVSISWAKVCMLHLLQSAMAKDGQEQG
jgi:hypothetical protein